ncbi:MAG: tetratricopeptide repeat protein [Bacteroidetes bacterium]|nr:tetratricopeptide repeat protein [Bacteroidota bacterium]
MKIRNFYIPIIFLILVVFEGCSKKSDDYYMGQAKKSVEQKNIPAAVEAYQDLVTNYPNSQMAPQALFELATLYQNKMVKNDNQSNGQAELTDTQSLEKAISLFRSIFDKYPNSEYAPKALFMSGFIQSNDLKQFSDATATFNLFIQKYPNNELVSSAKEELNNMGLSPEDILQKKNNSKVDVSNK